MNKEELKIGDWIYIKDDPCCYIGIITNISNEAIECKYRIIKENYINKITALDFMMLNYTVNTTWFFDQSKIHKFDVNNQDSLRYQNIISSIFNDLSTNFTCGANPYIGMTNKENFWSKNDANLFGIHFSNSKLSIKLAKEQEFKVRKLTTREKTILLLDKLKDLIDDSLGSNNKHKFEIYSKRYNKIKNKYSQLISK